MSTTLLRVLMTWNLKQKDARYVAKLFLKLFDKLPTLDQKIEILYTLADFPPDKFEKIILYMRPAIVYLIKTMTFSRLRVLLLFYARKCPNCLKILLEKFRTEISQKLETLHFNDVIVFSLDLTRIHEDSGLYFVTTFRSTIADLARSEGFTHFGTIIWHMLMMKQHRLAEKVFDALYDIITVKAKYLSDIQNFVNLIHRVNPEFAKNAMRRLRPVINKLMAKASERERKMFLSFVSRYGDIYTDFIDTDTTKHISDFDSYSQGIGDGDGHY